MDAVERLSEKVELARIDVPGYVRMVNGVLQRVGKYSYDRAASRLLDWSYEQHSQWIEMALARNRSRNTSMTHATGGKWGVWKPERAKKHKQIVDELWDEQFRGVPSAGLAVMTGGLMGAGKSTIIDSGKVEGVVPGRYGRIDADMVKEKLAEHGMIPEVRGLAPMEAATLVHEESALLAAQLADRAYAERKNLIWDVSMVDTHTIDSRLRKLRNAGYKEVRGVFVDITPELAWQRVKARHRRDLERWLHGEGNGGRYVPERLVLKNRSFGGRWKSGNREVFERNKDTFDRWEVWDTSGLIPQKTSEGKGFGKASKPSWAYDRWLTGDN